MIKPNAFAIFTFTTIMIVSYFFGATLVLITPPTQQAIGATYYSPQTNFEENEIPVTSHKWNTEKIDGCIYKEEGISNSYYVWTKLAVQSWRQALREYTGNYAVWNITARHITSSLDEG